MQLSHTIDHAELGPEGRAELAQLIGELIDFANEHGIDLIAALRGEDLAEARTEAQTWTPPPPPPFLVSYELDVDADWSRIDFAFTRKGYAGADAFGTHFAPSAEAAADFLTGRAAAWGGTATFTESRDGETWRIDLSMPSVWEKRGGAKVPVTWSLAAEHKDLNTGIKTPIAMRSVDPASEFDPQPEAADPEAPAEGGSDAPSQSWLAQELAKAAGVSAGLVPDGEAGGSYQYGLYWNPGSSGEYQLRFDGELTTPLTPGATGAQIDAALEALDGITSAEVTGEPGSWELSLEADAGKALLPYDLAFDGDMALVLWDA